MSKRFLVCIDSDGCVFDTMEIKHKECFCPSYIHYFGLQPVSKYARDAWDFANPAKLEMRLMPRNTALRSESNFTRTALYGNSRATPWLQM